MTQEELSELQHVKELFKKLQELQYSTIGDPALSVSLGAGGYLHSISVFVHVSEEYSNGKALGSFALAVFLSSKENEDACNACIAFVNAHRALRA